MIFPASKLHFEGTSQPCLITGISEVSNMDKGNTKLLMVYDYSNTLTKPFRDHDRCPDSSWDSFCIFRGSVWAWRGRAGAMIIVTFLNGQIPTRGLYFTPIVGGGLPLVMSQNPIPMIPHHCYTQDGATSANPPVVIRRCMPCGFLPPK